MLDNVDMTPFPSPYQSFMTLFALRMIRPETNIAAVASIWSQQPHNNYGPNPNIMTLQLSLVSILRNPLYSPLPSGSTWSIIFHSPLLDFN